MKKFLLAAAFGATAIAAPAFAQDAPPQPPRPGGMAMLDRLDTNKDGVITRDEFSADVARRFAKLDADKDGKVSQAELQAASPGGMGARGMTGDMTLADMQARADKRFERLDTNHDGKIDQAERDAIRARMGNRQASPPGSSAND
ncbi:EF-hand domain-containing protein [Sphingomonas sp. HITSZ_GF]|uniref:EF-hand domain-containing protein n=1 Tax=Sphingomonas sp. HITSZ_GF TaxID=3037247 RepID=UPI00240E0782|nr:EF-hand domain-containing protein [Sphingomonas sp. HITSZ_GF]MDG2532727.1 EF-hand domain-containing protein [Sphingomonas sp. HITSZ_GF]